MLAFFEENVVGKIILKFPLVKENIIDCFSDTIEKSADEDFPSSSMEATIVADLKRILKKVRDGDDDKRFAGLMGSFCFGPEGGGKFPQMILDEINRINVQD